MKVTDDVHLGLQSIRLRAGLPLRLAWQEPHEIQLGHMQSPAPEEERAHALAQPGDRLAGPACSAEKAWGKAGLVQASSVPGQQWQPAASPTRSTAV